jgi:hypothetical protein
VGNPARGGNSKEGEMGKCWLLESGEAKDFADLLSGRVTYRLTEFPSNPLEPIMEIRKKLESITCLAAEGPEVTPHSQLFQLITKEALSAIQTTSKVAEVVAEERRK